MVDVRRRASDEGFTLVETLVSIAMIGIVMTALVSVFTTSVSVSNQQRGKLAAVQLADDATEQIHAIKGSVLLIGRDQQSSDAQWSHPVPGVATLLADTTEVYDAGAPAGSGATAAVPTSPQTMTVGGQSFNENWYVGRCYLVVTSGSCVPATTSGALSMLQVVVAITWSERHCTDSQCSFVGSTMVSDSATEPVFSTSDLPVAPNITNPGNQTSDVSSTISLSLAASGGTAPTTWTAAGLPTGLSMNSSGSVTGTPTVAGTYSPVITATDAIPLVGTAAFTWTVNPLPTLTNPGTQTSPVGNPVALTMALAGGTGPVTWSAAGLPTGLALDASTGAITGTPTTVTPSGSQKTTVTVTDAVGKAGTVAFTWDVIPKPTVTAPTATTSISTNLGAAGSLQPVAAGDTGPVTWSAANLPTGLGINPATGLISGTATAGTRFLPTVTATDAKGAARSVTFEWKVVTTTGLRVTAPADRSDAVNKALSIPATAAGGSTSYKWTATGLPTGLSMTTAGVTSGTPTAAGAYTVTLVVKDSAGTSATLMFVWTVK